MWPWSMCFIPRIESISTPQQLVELTQWGWLPLEFSPNPGLVTPVGPLPTAVWGAELVVASQLDRPLFWYGRTHSP